MNLSQFWLIQKAHLKKSFYIIGLLVTLTLFISLLQQKIYVASTEVLLNSKGTDPVTGAQVPALLLPGYVGTQVDIITSHAVALSVANELELAKDQKYIQKYKKTNSEKISLEDWIANQLVKDLSVKPPRDSSVIEISFQDPDPKKAALLANSFAKAYQEVGLKMKVEPSIKAAKYLETQVKAFRDKLEAAQQRLAQYQQENGITSATDVYDIENTKLNQLANQLASMQTRALESGSRQIQNNAAGEASSDVSASPVIQDLKLRIAAAAAKVAELSEKLAPNHPSYIAAQSQVDQLKAQLASETANIGRGLNSNAKIYQQSEAELRAAVEAQKQKVLDINRSRDQLAVLQRDVESAQLAFNTVNQRFNQTSVEGKTNESDISILNVAIPPVNPAKPRVFLNVFLAFFFGLILASGTAIFIEMGNRIIRTPDDISDLIGVPLLEVIPKAEEAENKQQTLLLPNFRGK